MYIYFLNIYWVQNDGSSLCQINSIVPGDLAWLCVAKLLRWQVAAACRDEDRQSWHTPQRRTAAPQRGRANPTVYRYTYYRLNTRARWGNDRVCFPVRACAPRTYTKAWFFFSFFLLLLKAVVSLCVYVPVWGYWLLSAIRSRRPTK